MACISFQINVAKDELCPKLKLDITLKILIENLRKYAVGWYILYTKFQKCSHCILSSLFLLLLILVFAIDGKV